MTFVFLISPSMIISRSIHVAANGAASFFFMAECYSCVCVYTPHLYPFFCQWTFRLLPCLSYYKQCCNEYWGIISIIISLFAVIQNPYDCCQARLTLYCVCKYKFQTYIKEKNLICVKFHLANSSIWNLVSVN